MNYPNLSKPMMIGNVKIKNRMMMAPMDTGFGNNAWGGFTPEGVEYFARRAEGGFGLLFSGGTSADCKVDNPDSMLNHADEFIRVGRELNERIGIYGCKMFIQLSMDIGRNAGLKTPSPLPVLGNPSITTTALTVDEIHTRVEEMGQAAKLCKEAGYAGVDIHALHWGHLLDSFALAFMNHREDKYGGSLENRMRIVKEIREAIAKECGWDYPVTIRFAVTLYEKSNVLGGNLVPAGAHDFKHEVNCLNEYYKHQMETLGIDVKLNTEVTTEMLKSMNADAIILAVGSVPVMPRIDGIDHPKTVSGVDALLEKRPIGDKVIIVGGGLVGCEIAYGYAKEGKDVTIVEALDEIMKTNNVPAMNKIMLLDAFEYYGTKVLTSARLNAVNDDGAVVTLSDGTVATLEADNVIMSVGYRPLPSMQEALAGCGAELYEIGDGAKVGNVLTCIRDAFEVTRNM